MSTAAGPRSALRRLRRRLTRATLPRTVLRAARVRSFVRERMSRAGGTLGLPPRIELYFAFDDPYGVIALREVVALARSARAALVVYPVVEHGIPSDPDLSLRRAYAIQDAARLLRRTGGTLARRSVVEPEDVRFLAGWMEAARVRGADLRFAMDAMAELWVSSDGPIDDTRYRAIYERAVGSAPPVAPDGRDARLACNTARLRSRGHWETPAARIAGEWFFAHERVEQMRELLARIGG